MNPVAERIANLFVEESSGLSTLIKEDKPSLYLLNATDNSLSTDLRWFETGQPNQSNKKDHKVIILMGATGSGKSTLIEGMVNFILGVQWNDPFRFKCVREDESESRNQAHSQTSSVTAYTIHHQEGMTVPYSITLIDTPGYGDTRGVARDKEITKTIHQFLMQKDSRIDEIHAACFVAASSNSRLTVTQRYILDSVLSIFGKDFRDNIRLLVTFADNADPPVVEACRVAHFPTTSPSEGITYSKFNSSVLYASNREEGDSSFDELFWDMGQENFQKFFKMLERMNGKDLKSTRQVIQQRQLLQKSLRCIESELEVYFAKIENIVILLNKISANDFTKKMNQNSIFEKTEILFDKVNCDTGFMAFNCTKCRKTCEEPIRLEGAGNMKMTKSCEMPTCKCPMDDHTYQDFVWKIVPVRVKTTLEAMKADYVPSNRTGSNTQEEIVARCLEEQSQVKVKVIFLLQQVGATGRFLDSTALRSNALSPADYLSLMRSRVAEDQAPGYLTRLETLTELQQLITEIELGQQSFKNIENQLEVYFASIENMNMFFQKMKQYSHDMESNKNVVVEKTEVLKALLECKKGFEAYNCQNCKASCEVPMIMNDSKYIDIKEQCKKCGCPAQKHVYEPFVWCTETVTVQITLEELKTEYELKYEDKFTNKEFFKKCSEELCQTKAKVMELLNQVGAKSLFLDSKALPFINVLTPSDYLRLIKNQIAEEESPGYLTRLEILTKLQKFLVETEIDGRKASTTSSTRSSTGSREHRDSATPLIGNRNNSNSNRCCFLCKSNRGSEEQSNRV